MSSNNAITRFLWVAVIFLALHGVLVATRRAVVLIKPGAMNPNRNPAAALDAHFAKEKSLALLHVIPGMIFMILGPFQFVRRLRERHPAVHRWTGRIFLAASTVIGLTGLTMAVRGTIGGWDEKSAILLFGSFFLFSLGKALWHVLHREFHKHREWMIRGYAVGLAVATIRPIMGGFFAAALIGGHAPQPERFFGAAFWIGFTVQTIVAEIWVRRTRRNQFGAELSALTSS